MVAPPTIQRVVRLNDSADSVFLEYRGNEAALAALAFEAVPKLNNVKWRAATAVAVKADSVDFQFHLNSSISARAS
jgi:hypothetical protein